MAASSSGAGGGRSGRMELPQRSTRGKRMRAAMEEEEEADQEFWNQEFFAEEEVDDDYQEEVEEEDVVDSDFDEPEDEEDDEDEDRDVEERPKRKALKAPEPKGPPKAKAAPKAPQAAAQAAADAAEAEEQQQQQGTPTPAGPSASGGKMRGAKALMALQQGLNPEQQALLLQEQQTAAPTLRRSTVAKTQEAVKERQHREQAKPARPRSAKSSEWRPLTQAELLAEAARTEVDNLYSLRQLLAMEEETKKKAVVQKQQYRGPLVKWISRKHQRADAPPEPPPPPPPPSQKDPPPPEPQQQPQQQQAAPPEPPAAGEAPPPGAVPRPPAVSHIQAGGGSAKQQQREEEEEAAKKLKQEEREGRPLSAVAADELLRYEGTLSFELHNMHYPPLWLRRWKAPQPQPPAACAAVPGALARYRDPQTKVPFSSAAAFRRIRGLPQLRVPLKPPAPPPPPPSSSKGFNRATCVFAGASDRGAPTAALRRALAALPLPPPALPLPPPTVHLTPVHPMSLPTPLMSLAMDVTKAPSSAAAS